MSASIQESVEPLRILLIIGLDLKKFEALKLPLLILAAARRRLFFLPVSCLRRVCHPLADRKMCDWRAEDSCAAAIVAGMEDELPKEPLAKPAHYL